MTDNLDPGNPDTDGDGLLDGEEIGLGTDPLVPDNTPPTTTITSPSANQTFVEGFPLPIAATASDDGRVARVDFLVR